MAEADLERAKDVCAGLLQSLGGDLSAEGGMTKLSISGAGMMGRPGIAAGLITCLSQQGINLRLIATSEVKVSCVIDAANGRKALQAVREAFEVQDAQVQLNPSVCDRGEPEVRGVALDRGSGAAECAARAGPSGDGGSPLFSPGRSRHQS